MLSRGHRLRTREFARRKRKTMVIKTALMALILVVVVGGASLAARIPSFLITEISVEGAEVSDSSALATTALAHLSGSYFFLFPKSNVFIYPERSIEAAVLDSFKRLNSADVHFEHFRKLKLSVTERVPEALWCGENRLGADSTAICYFMDAQGFIFTEAPDFTGRVYMRFYGPLESGEPVGQVFLDSVQFSELMRFVRALEAVQVTPTALAVIDDMDYELYLESGTRVLFSRSMSVERVEDNLLSVLTSEDFKNRPLATVEYIDLRFGNKVYYKEIID